MTMSVHDALQAWIDGEISTERAMQLSGATTMSELHRLAKFCDVDYEALKARAARGDPAAALMILDRVPDVEPEPGDELDSPKL